VYPSSDEDRHRWLAGRQLTYPQQISVDAAHSHEEWQANVDEVRRTEVADRVAAAASAGQLPHDLAQDLLGRVAARADPAGLENQLAALGVPGIAPALAPPPLPPAAVPMPATNLLAVAALVFAFLFAPLGIVFGHVALHQIKRTGEGGRGLAIAALVVAYLVIALTLLAVLVVGLALADLVDYCSSHSCVVH
jgi:hypothetical protein